MSVRALFRNLALLAAICMSTSAFAQTQYCVSGLSGLRSALDDAEIDGTDSVIRIRSGTVTMSQDAVYEPEVESIIPAGKLTIRGGYNADCSSYSLAAGATTLSSSNGSRLSIRTLTGDASVAGLTFQGTHLSMISIVLSDCPGSRRLFSLSRVRINGAGFAAVGWCHHVKIANSLFTSPVAVPGSGFAADTGVGVDLPFNEEGYGSSSNLTMVNSTISGGRLDIDSDSAAPGTAYLYNSIFSRSGDDIFSSADVYARNNRYDGISYSGSAGLVGGSGENTSVAAQLDAQFIPQPGSPAVNTGTSAVPDGLAEVDQAGNDRVIGARPDMGALESPVDGTGVYTVTNTNASGTGSLAWALNLANTDPAYNQIRFNIPGGCPKRITPGGSLQVYGSVSFDGSTQPGAVPNTGEQALWNGAPCIVLNGGGTRGIGIEAMGDLATNGGHITVRALAFENYDLAVGLVFGTAHSVQGSQFGGVVAASGGGSAITLAGNTDAIAILGGSDTNIGGSAVSSRNLISGSSGVGVHIAQFLGGGGNGNRIINNVFGLSRNSLTALPNGTGILINGGDNEVTGNLIAGSTVDGIRIAGDNATGNRVVDNTIGGGTGAFSLIPPNGRMGIMVENGAWKNTIGPDNAVGRNGDDGVRIYLDAGGRNRINGNTFAFNDALGIDLGSNGVSANDNDPSFCPIDGGCVANRGQNFPSLSKAIRMRTGAIPVGRPINVRGTLRSVPGGPYRVELFAGASCEANGHGEGQRLVGAVEFSIPNLAYCPVPGGACLACSDGNCTEGFSLWISELDAIEGDSITATATSPSGDTSEFSACEELVDEIEEDRIFADDFED
ncbi:MAG: right-handed parallel beta-helix repeat-containing protein [Xanthomonadales bacterium]|nr:right-handed parallel beta-helix repeat-containing protein [Xanthomonadales bacterium]